MSTINSIYFRNYKSFQTEYSCIPLKPLTVLIGRNNSGKTSCIDVIEALCDHKIMYSSKMKSLDLYVTKKLADSEWKDLLQKSGYNQHPPYPTVSPSKDLLDSIVCKFTIEQHINEREPISFRLVSDNYIKSLPKICWGELVNELEAYIRKIHFFRINAERDILPEPEDTSKKLLENGQGATSLINYILNRESENEHIIKYDLLNALNEIIYPDTEYSEINVKKIDDTNWEVFLYEGDNRYALSKMGSGLKTVILVLLNLLVIPTQQHLYDEDDIIFAFEELENNLHPALQRRLYDYIIKYSKEKPNTYIFLTTHSHVAINIFADIKDAQILHVTKGTDQSHINVIDDFISKSNILNDLDVRASDLLQSNGIIWVEGPSDRIYIKHWLNLRGGHDLIEGVDYQFLYYGGRLLSHYTADTEKDNNELIKLLTINRHSAILIDSDKKKKNDKINSTKERLQDEFSKMGLFCWITEGKEIENYIPHQAINDTFKCNLEQCGQYKLFPEYIKNVRKNFTTEKVFFAAKVSEHIKDEDDYYVLDLKERIDDLIKVVHSWKPQK